MSFTFQINHLINLFSNILFYGKLRKLNVIEYHSFISHKQRLSKNCDCPSTIKIDITYALMEYMDSKRKKKPRFNYDLSINIFMK